MSDDRSKVKPKRRWRTIATGVVALTVLYFAGSAWQNRRWIDPRFVGAWRVTDSKSSLQSVYVLRADGSARMLYRNDEGARWREYGPRGAPFYWSVSRDGFLLQNLNSPSSQFAGWLLSLGGLFTKGRFTAPRVVSNSADEILFVSDDQVRLLVPQPGITVPLILTLDRMDAAEVPPAQP
jgi:hypothetical protein